MGNFGVFALSREQIKPCRPFGNRMEPQFRGLRRLSKTALAVLPHNLRNLARFGREGEPRLRPRQDTRSGGKRDGWLSLGASIWAAGLGHEAGLSRRTCPRREASGLTSPKKASKHRARQARAAATQCSRIARTEKLNLTLMLRAGIAKPDFRACVADRCHNFLDPLPGETIGIARGGADAGGL